MSPARRDVRCNQEAASQGKVGLTADLDGCLELEQDRLVDEDFARLGAQEPDLVLLKLDLLAWAVAANCRSTP